MKPRGEESRDRGQGRENGRAAARPHQTVHARERQAADRSDEQDLRDGFGKHADQKVRQAHEEPVGDPEELDRPVPRSGQERLVPFAGHVAAYRRRDDAEGVHGDGRSADRPAARERDDGGDARALPQSADDKDRPQRRGHQNGGLGCEDRGPTGEAPQDRPADTPALLLGAKGEEHEEERHRHVARVLLGGAGVPDERGAGGEGEQPGRECDPAREPRRHAPEEKQRSERGEPGEEPQSGLAGAEQLRAQLLQQEETRRGDLS